MSLPRCGWLIWQRAIETRRLQCYPAGLLDRVYIGLNMVLSLPLSIGEGLELQGVLVLSSAWKVEATFGEFEDSCTRRDAEALVKLRMKLCMPCMACRHHAIPRRLTWGCERWVPLSSPPTYPYSVFTFPRGVLSRKILLMSSILHSSAFVLSNPHSPEHWTHFLGQERRCPEWSQWICTKHGFEHGSAWRCLWQDAQHPRVQQVLPMRSSTAGMDMTNATQQMDFLMQIALMIPSCKLISNSYARRYWHGVVLWLLVSLLSWTHNTSCTWLEVKSYRRSQSIATNWGGWQNEMCCGEQH